MSRKATEQAHALQKAMAQYRRDHGGRSGPRGVRTYSAADPSLLSIELGELVAVVYRTRKGADRVLTDYEHHFKSPYPILAYNDSGLLIAGGIYHVTARGILD